MRPAIALVVVLLSAMSPAQASDPAAEARVEQLLTAMGGREAWAKARSMQNVATQYSTQVDEPFTNIIWNDFESPRIRIEQHSATMDRVRAFEGDSGWRIRDGVPSRLDADYIADERMFWEANVYRTLHRLALADPALTPRLDAKGRLEIMLADGRRLCWFDLNAKDEPYAFGTWADDTGGIFGPLVTAASGGILIPAWGSSPDGTWRYVIDRVEVYDGPPPVSFEPPEGVVFPSP